MVDPKAFYRDFDDLLQKIRKGKTGKGFLVSILKEVQRYFGESLKIGGFRIYEERADHFIFVESDGSAPALDEQIAKESPAAQMALSHGSYIFDQRGLSFQQNQTTGQYSIPAAMVIQGPAHRWIVVVELRSGWMREEVMFSLNAIATSINQRLFAEAIQTDLEQAAQIQSSLLPQELPKLKDYDISVRYQPTEIVGGDLYDFFTFEADTLGVCIGDASGHGLPAALLVRDCVTGLRMGLERHLKMVYSLEKLNSVVHRSTYSSRFVSLFYGEIEPDGNLIYVNAGHPMPFIITDDGVWDLKATGLIIGALPNIKLQRAFANIPPGGVFVLYTDGIFERENRDEESFNIDRLKELVRKNKEKNAAEIVDIIFDTVFEFGGKIKWEDDTTVVVIKREKRAAH